MNNAPIGILDSGVGGLAIWRQIIKQLPHEVTMYIADSKNCPYGSRSEEEIYGLARRLVQFLIDQNCKLIILACNTITVSCLDRLRRDFKDVPIVGTVPVIKTAVEQSRNGRIGILSTTLTAQSQYQRDLINRFAQHSTVINRGTDMLVPFIERGDTDSAELIDILKRELTPLVKEDIDVLALGCSHFPFIKKQMGKILGKNVEILDSGAAIARQVKRILKSREAVAGSKKSIHRFFTTGNSAQFSEFLRTMGYNNSAKHVEL